jgi:hypothetical protein
MSEKIKKKRTLLLATIFISNLFFNCSARAETAADDSTQTAQPEKLILFVIKFDLFLCSPCLNPFFDFYRLLPSPFRENKVWGIIVCSETAKRESTAAQRRIADKKLRAFLRANDITCPVVIDYSGDFERFSKKKTNILLFDPAKKLFKKLELPLNQEQKREVLDFIQDERER